MGSPLGPLFANFYMCHIENAVLQDPALRPHIYARYVDDIFVNVEDDQHLRALKEALEAKSVLKFTYETSKDKAIPFLDVKVQVNEDKTFNTSVHRKATDGGNCLNAESECPERYKTSVIRAFVRRAIHHSSTWQALHAELERSRQILVNNGYSNKEVDAEIRKHLDRQFQVTEKDKQNNTAKIDLFYRSQMTTAYKTEERVIKDMIKSHVKCRHDNKSINFVIYYQTRQTLSLVMSNNLAVKQSRQKENSHLKKINVIYRFSCPEEGCRLLHND